MDIRFTQENLYKNVKENYENVVFIHILCKFSCICNFAIFVRIFINFSPKCRSKKLGMIYTILGNFAHFFNWERADIRLPIRHKKIPAFCHLLIFFKHQHFRNTIRVSKVWIQIRPDLLSCLFSMIISRQH